MAEQPPPPVRPEEAIAWHQERVPMGKAAFQALAKQARSQAFTVAGVAQASVLADVHGALDKALADGTTLEDFKAQVGEKLGKEWAGSVKKPARRIETIFRTNTQAAYNAGRHKQATDPDIAELRPYWRYVAVIDARTSPMCREAHGTVLKQDDPWWQTHFPPLHPNCRCTFETLSTRQAERLGVTTETSDAPEHQPEDGFGLQPVQTSEPEERRLPPAAAIHEPSGLPLPPLHLDYGANLRQARDAKGSRLQLPPPVIAAELPPALLPAGFPSKSGTYTLPLTWLDSLHADPAELSKYASLREAHEVATVRGELPDLPPIEVTVHANGHLSLDNGNHRLTVAREFRVPLLPVTLTFEVPLRRMTAVWS